MVILNQILILIIIQENQTIRDKTKHLTHTSQKQVKFEDKGNREPLHVINAVNLRKRHNRESQVIGVAIFDYALVNYLFDSGADRTIVNTKTFNLIKRHAPGTELEIHSGSELFSCSGPIKILGKVKLSRCIVSREEILKNVEILVTETVSNNDCLLGRYLINKLKHIGPRFEHINTMVKTMSDEVRRIFREEMREKRCKKTIKSCTYQNVKEEEVGSITNFDVEVHSENNFGKREGEVPKPKVCGSVIETEIVAELKETSLSKDDLNMEAVENACALLKNKIEEVSAKSVLDLKPDKNSDVAFEIEFQDPNQKPIKCRCRPLPWNLKEKVNTELGRQLTAGIIRPSRSQWCFPIRVVDKADGSIRITVDYKPLNKVIKDDNYPIPSIKDLYARLADADTFTKIDMKAAYHQIPVHPNSIQYTAFICEFGLFEYLSMIMGIKTAPAWFQRFIEACLQRFIIDNSLRVYLDDSIIFTNSEKNGINYHLDTVMAVLDTLNKRSLKVSFEKSVPVEFEIQLLGNVISKGKIKPDPNRALGLSKYGKPATINQLQSWLGIANFYRRFIDHYALLARPLYELMGLKSVPKSCRKRNGAVDGKKVQLVWNKEADEHFERLKSVLSSELVLALPNFERQMILTTDACDSGYGAVLEQEFDGFLRRIAFFR